MKITVIDYGLSNLLSVRRAFEYFGAEVEVTGSRSRILSAKALVLPGVGAFKDGMAGLSGLSLADAIADKCAVGTPLLGICLGMQMLFDESDEFGRHRGLGLIPGRVRKLPNSATRITISMRNASGKYLAIASMASPWSLYCESQKNV